MADPAWLSRQIHTWHVEQVAPFNPPTQAARAYRLERLANPDPYIAVISMPPWALSGFGTSG